MKKQMFSIYDSKVETWLPPFYANNKGEALRNLSNTLDSENNLSKYPEDFTLFLLGEFYENSGNIIPYESPESIIKLIELKKDN
ncbi:nonstructural protein [Microviridae sp.]|nr:nonstructural protein [Microviridae sp.]